MAAAFMNIVSGVAVWLSIMTLGETPTSHICAHEFLVPSSVFGFPWYSTADAGRKW